MTKAAHSCSLLWLLAWPALAAGVELRFAPEADYGPFVYADAQGRVGGLSVELLQALAPLGGFQVRTLPPRSLHEILSATQRGEVDVISSLRPTAERSRFLAFTEPYVSVPAVLALPPGRASQSELAALNGHAVGVGRGYAVEGFVRERYPGVRWVSFDDDRLALQAMLRGEVEAVVADLASLHFLNQRDASMLRFEVHQHIGFEYALSFAYPIERPDIGELLRKALRELPQPTRRQITQRWVPEGRFAYQDPRQADLRLIASLCIAAGLLSLFLVMRHHARTVGS
jgi:ABC-type amino acid transport substrate-binding protein